MRSRPMPEPEPDRREHVSNREENQMVHANALPPADQIDHEDIRKAAE